MTATASSRPDRPHATAERLLRSSARHSYDPEIDIDWSTPIDRSLWGMQPEWTSLYGTPLWDGLEPDQQRELSRHEAASIASVGLWFELILMQMMLRDAYDDDPTSPHMHYALTEVADECRHSTMFGKAVAHMGVPAYGPPPAVHRLGRLFSLVVRGPSAYASILVAEEILDVWQRDVMKDERVEPLVRMIARIHVLEEARHMAFAREEVREQAAGMSWLQRQVQARLTAHTCFMVARSLVNPRVYASVGIDPRAGRRAALGNPHYRATMQRMGAGPVAFLREQGLAPRSQDRVWRGSLLVG